MVTSVWPLWLPIIASTHVCVDYLCLTLDLVVWAWVHLCGGTFVLGNFFWIWLLTPFFTSCFKGQTFGLSQLARSRNTVIPSDQMHHHSRAFNRENNNPFVLFSHLSSPVPQLFLFVRVNGEQWERLLWDSRSAVIHCCSVNQASVGVRRSSLNTKTTNVNEI